MASGKMKSFSLVGKSLIWAVMLSAVCAMPSAMAGDMISGAELKDHVRSVLMARGLDSRPMISDTRQFRACDTPFEVTPMFGGYKTVRLTCPDVDGFKIAVRTQIDSFVDDETETVPTADRAAAFTKFVVLTKSLQTGEIISADDVKLVSRDTNPGVGYFRDINDVVGRKAKRAININQIIRTRHLELDYAIQKDQSVIIESKIGPVTVVSAGIAVDDAQLGELVKVKNDSSGLVVEGVAISEKKIRIRAK
jgi:flagella basal body P-ring formation protein FlgA